jgi:hypothetical protein
MGRLGHSELSKDVFGTIAGLYPAACECASSTDDA